ncbi:MAG: TetR/AcrR family transcriptional regulator [Cellvibrionaceae bacterium]|nr:TetR/AcrR family transcriptional regulator [Cellvibrionaceae bacterium]
MSDKKQELLECALKLFYQKGVNSVGINEILQISGISKKTLYKHFDSKESLILEALKLRSEEYLQWIDAIIPADASEQEVVDALFSGLDLWFSGNNEVLGDFKGCFFINVAYEYKGNSGEITEYCKEHQFKFRDLINSKLSNESTELLDSICLLVDGAINRAYVCDDKTSAKHSLDIIKRLYFH